MTSTALIYTRRQPEKDDWAQGPKEGGICVHANPDGNFALVQSGSLPRHGLELDQDTFGRVFGRVPPRGLTIRADVFLRLCTLGGLKTGLTKDGQNHWPGPDDIWLFTHEEIMPPLAPIKAIQYQPDGNFCLTADFTFKTDVCGFGLSFENFERAFGLEPRNYFANEVLRIAGLLGMRLVVEEA